jgi:hypothetical protein
VAETVYNPIGTSTVTLRTLDGREHYQSGETLQFEVTSDLSGYLYLLVFSEQGRATCIFPNPSSRENRVSAGSTRLPNRADYEFPVQEPFGREVVVAVISKEKKPLCDRVRYSWYEVYERIDLRTAHASLRSRALRGIGVQRVESATAAQAGGDTAPSAQQWQTAALILETSRSQ